jgi:two-component system sensor histidine kinase MprB
MRPDFMSVVPSPRPKALRNGELLIMRDDLAGLLAHDVKTPLAAISMNLDFALAELSDETSEGVRAAIDDCRAANARAIRIVSDMADAVRLAAGDRIPNFTHLDPAEVIASVVERAASEAAARGVRIVWRAEEESVVRADKDLLTRALDRLLERALRQARGGGTIDVVLRPGTVTIRVESVSCGVIELPARTLAMYFAEAAMRAQGGAVWTETDGDGAMLYRVALAR